MTSTRIISASAGAAALALGAAAAAAQDDAPAPEMPPAGTYEIDPFHASVIFRVDHLGFSNYTARFLSFDATLEIDPSDPASAELVARIDPASVDTGFADPDVLDFDSLIESAEFLDAAQFPEIVYRSTAVTLTGPATARIDGELTLHGVTAPVALDAEFNGGWAGIAQDPNARIGFSARGDISRSAFGIDNGLPPPGSSMGVGDIVEVIIEAEFAGPALEGAGE